MKKLKCSGSFCIMNRGFSVDECELYETCENYTPTIDTSGTDAVIDMTMKQFDIDESERKKLEILFNAYVSQWRASAYRLTPMVNVKRCEREKK